MSIGMIAAAVDKTTSARPRLLPGWVDESIRPGCGRIRFERVNGATALVQCAAASPLKLLALRCGPAASVVAGTFGGGLLAADDVRLDVTAGPQTRCVIGTQASTKIYRSENGQVARQSLRAVIDRDATLVVAPDPVACFAGARFEQRQTYDLDLTGSLLLIDWLSSGRPARGERWAFDRFRSDIAIGIDGQPIARDALLLDPADGPVGATYRLGRFDCIATTFIVGPAFNDAVVAIRASVERTRLHRQGELLVAASPIRGGAMLRLAGAGIEPVGRLLKELLKPAWTAFGADPWERKVVKSGRGNELRSLFPVIRGEGERILRFDYAPEPARH